MVFYGSRTRQVASTAANSNPRLRAETILSLI